MLPRSDIRLWVIIPVYGNWGDTLECLRALEAQNCREFRVLVADDGSPEPPPDEVHAFPFAQYYRGPNLGFGGNCNRAARMALDEGATHLLLLNSDTTFAPEFIGAWLGEIEVRPEIIASPLVYWADRPEEVWFSGGPMSIWLPYFRHAKAYAEPTPVEIVCGCTLLVPAPAWRKLNGFDERFVTYYEDFDLVLRAKSLGIAVFVLPAAGLKVLHHVSGSFREGGAWRKQYLMLTSRLQFIRIHERGFHKLGSLILAAAHFMVQVLIHLPELPEPKRLWQAVADGLKPL